MLLLWGFMTLLLLFFVYIKRGYEYWKKKEIPYIEATSFLFGNFKDAFTLKKSFIEVHKEIYDKFNGCSYLGYYKVQKPALLIRDPELIKDILIKDFKNFQHNDVYIDEKADPFFGRNPFILRDNRWKVARSQITPCFTSGRLKYEYDFMMEVGKKLQKYLEQNCNNTAGLEVKELSGKFACDSVLLSGLGLNGKSFEDPDAVLRQMARNMFNTTFWMNLKSLFIFMVPPLSKILGIKIMTNEMQAYIRSLVSQTIKYRKDNKIHKNDFLGYLIDLQEKNPDELNESDIHIHVGTLFIDGFETSSLALALCLYCLAKNLDVQKKLREEIDLTYEANNGKITYEVFQSMSYLDQVFKETVRIFPPLTTLSKVCAESFTLPPSNNHSKPLNVEEGTPITISVYSLHNDETYFPDPHCFNPDRFSPENINNIVKCSYLPFGDGPRICIGRRFGEQQTKVAVLNILKEFEIRLNEKTDDPLQFAESSIIMGIKKGIWLNFYKRK